MKNTSGILGLVISLIFGLQGRADAFDKNAHKRLSEKEAEASTQMESALLLLGTEFAEGLDTPLPGGKIKDHIAEISKGNHAVSGVPGPIEETAALVCLHAPLRSRAVLAAKAATASRVHEEDPDPGIAWQTKRWGRLAAEGRLDEEWAANSQAHGTLDVRGTSRPLTFDTTLRDVVKPWLSLPQRLRGWLLVSR